MARESLTYQCPACGGPLHFDAQTGVPTCDYCDSTFTVEQVEAYYAEKQAKADAAAMGDSAVTQPGDSAGAHAAGPVPQPVSAADGRERAREAQHAGAYVQAQVTGDDAIAAYLQSKKPLEEGDANAACVVCSSCGAALIVSGSTAVSQCPYCGNNTVVPGTLGDTLEPDLVIPFETTKEQAVEALKEHYKGKFLLPKAFKAENHIEEIQGVYVPFWLFDAKAEGSQTFRCENHRYWSDSDYDYVETTKYSCYRRGSTRFARIPADGSKRMPDDMMDSIEPFDFSKLKPFSMGYLPGFLTERYDADVKYCAPRAQLRALNTLGSRLESTVTGYDTVLPDNHVDGDVFYTNVSYALFPVWMLHTKWNGGDYLFAMNGQTGRMVGDLPCDNKKMALTGLLSFLGAAVLGVLLTFLIV